MRALDRLRSERGMTITELLVAMTLMIVILSATLNTIDTGNANRRLNDDRNDSVDQARTAIDRVVRQLRNLASPSASAPNAITWASANDLIFRTFDPNRRLVRYCLETDDNGVLITTQATRLIQMVSNINDTPGVTDKCTVRTTGWSSVKVVASRVVNQRVAPPSVNWQTKSLFAYNSTNLVNTSTISNIRMQLAIDVNSAAKRPTPITLSSGAALRNQNRPPIAVFSVAKLSTRRFILNATGSSDPENHNLIYKWYADVGAGFTPSSANFLAAGPVLDYTFPTAVGTPSSFYVKLVVSDSNLTDTCPTSSSTANCSTAGPLNWS